MYLLKALSDKTLREKKIFFVAFLKFLTKLAGSGAGSFSQRYQNVMDPQHSDKNTLFCKTRHLFGTGT
jgi:hypothetical protein